MVKRLVAFGDVHGPIEDRKLVKAFTAFLGEYQPDELVCVGDLADYNGPSRWSKDTAAEYQNDVFEESAYIQNKILEPIRKVYAGPFGFIEGNHDSRPRDYLTKYAPALSASLAFEPSVLLDFQGFDIDVLDEFYDFAPGWTMTHGHRGGIRLSQLAGQTALNAAKKFGKSVVHGHTHRLGKMSHSIGYGGQINQTLTGVETGNMIDQKLAGYLKGATGNWQSGFAVFYIDGAHVQAETIAVSGKKFTVEGKTYSV